MNENNKDDANLVPLQGIGVNSPLGVRGSMSHRERFLQQ